MPASATNQAIGHLSALLDAANHRDLSDRQLLEQFATGRDQTAFGQIVHRHGSLVLGVCRRILGNAQDAEDAFQATFLVLARKAGDSGWQDSIAGWLHEVAVRTAKKSRQSRFRSRARERQAATMPRPDPIPDDDAPDLASVLDEEIGAMPEKFRVVFVLVYLEGLTRDEAAGRLGVTVGSIKDRLERGRELLRKRLTRRGVNSRASSAFLAAPVSVPAVSASLMQKTIEASVAFATGAGAAGTTATTLAEGVLQAMTITKTKIFALLGTIVCIGAAMTFAATSGVGRIASPAIAPPIEAGVPNDQAPQPVARLDEEKGDEPHEVSGVVVKVDTAAFQLVARVDEDEKTMEKTYTIPASIPVIVAHQPMQLAEIRPNMLVKLYFKTEKDTTPFKVEASWKPIVSDIKSVDVRTNQITISVESREDVVLDISFPVASGAKIELDDIAIGLTDLVGRMGVEVHLSADKKSINRIGVDTARDEFPATILGADPKTSEVTLEFDLDGDRRLPLTLPLAKDAKIRVAGSDSQALYLVQDMPARIQLGADRRTVTRILADKARPRTEKKDD